MLEHRTAPLLPISQFARRQFAFAAISVAIVGAALGLGSAGYHVIAGLPWVDALLNAAMILSGMGPVDPMRTVPAKLFAAAYALFSGVAFVSTVAVLFAPLVHRFLHHFHLELAEDEPTPDPGRSDLA
ncbi:MAG: hypothetical protein ACREI8_05315 [Myxococcota bacterium]